MAAEQEPKTGAAPARPRIAITIHLPNGGAIGPDDIALVEAIGRLRSITGAAEAVGVSYRTAWLAVDTLNRLFESRVIETFPGRRAAGAAPTPFGDRLVALYRSSERRATAGSALAIEEIGAAADPAYAAARAARPRKTSGGAVARAAEPGDPPR
jgi:molybdate transport system regulatory protein